MRQNISPYRMEKQEKSEYLTQTPKLHLITSLNNIKTLQIKTEYV